MGLGAVVGDSGEVWEARCSSALSSVTVMGVGMSRAGASMRALSGLVWLSGAGGACAGASCGGGVGSCMGTSMSGLSLLAASSGSD